jgi:hypothetical protein
MRALPRLLAEAGLDLNWSRAYVVADIGRAEFWLSSIASFRASGSSAHAPRWPPGTAGGPVFGQAASLAAYQTEVRPFTRKITSTLSKLVLSVRAVWGLMGPSAEEEVALQASFDDLAAVEGEDDVEAQRANREDTLRSRQDVETKLRWDVVDGAREVSDGVLKFVDEVERLSGGVPTGSSAQSRLSDRAMMPTLKRPLAVLRLGASAIVPGAGAAGNWRGNGFVGLPPPSPPPSADGFSTGSAATATQTFPSAPLTAETLASLAADARGVAEVINQLRSTINVVVAKANKRASTASARSTTTTSSRPSTPAGGGLPHIQPNQPNHTPLQSAARHLTKIGGSTANLLSGLAHYLSLAEDVDVASRIDFDLSPSIIPALQHAIAEDAHGKGRDRSDIPDAHVEALRRTMQKAQPLLNGLERAKQALYDASPTLLLAVQAIGLSSTTESVPAMVSAAAPNRAQPAEDSPLTSFAVPARFPDPLATIAAALDAIDMGVRFTAEAFNALLGVANEQDTLSPDLRRLAHHVRSQALGRPSMSRTASGHLPSLQRSLPNLQSAYGGLRGLGLEDENATEDTQTEASSLDGDFFYPNRQNSNSTTQTSVARTSGGDPPLPGQQWDAGGTRRLRDSYPSSVASSGRREPLAAAPAVAQAMSRAHTASTPSVASNDSEAGSPTVQALPHSPNKSKLRKFFGDEAPPTSLRRSGGPAGLTPFWLEADYEDELMWNVEGQVKSGTLRALVARLTSHESGASPPCSSSVRK